jgi:hypothetical protein
VDEGKSLAFHAKHHRFDTDQIHHRVLGSCYSFLTSDVCFIQLEVNQNLRLYILVANLI